MRFLSVSSFSVPSYFLHHASSATSVLCLLAFLPYICRFSVNHPIPMKTPSSVAHNRYPSVFHRTPIRLLSLIPERFLTLYLLTSFFFLSCITAYAETNLPFYFLPARNFLRHIIIIHNMCPLTGAK